jgi:hypothetical protein
MRSVEAKIALTALYETKFGIYDHFSQYKKRPLAIVALHPCENINQNGLLEQIIRAYSKRGIKDVFGLNIQEFLDLPMDIAEMLMKVADEHRAANQQTLSEIEKEMHK